MLIVLVGSETSMHMMRKLLEMLRLMGSMGCAGLQILVSPWPTQQPGFTCKASGSGTPRRRQSSTGNRQHSSSRSTNLGRKSGARSSSSQLLPAALLQALLAPVLLTPPNTGLGAHWTSACIGT